MCPIRSLTPQHATGNALATGFILLQDERDRRAKKLKLQFDALRIRLRKISALKGQ